jgi:hypothetical protein
MRSNIGKIMVTTVAILTLLIINVMDLNETHLTNPLWTGHARFHWAIEHMQICLLNILAIVLVWQKQQSKFLILVSCSLPMLFWGLFPFTALFPGTDSWPDGVSHPTTWPNWLNQFPPHKICSIVFPMISVISAYILLNEKKLNELIKKTL